nr:recombinase family protein [Leuconostoc mesenteroides]
MTIYGYTRVSTAEPSSNGQKETLKNSGAEIILSEKYSGTTTLRPQLEKLVALIKPKAHDYQLDVFSQAKSGTSFDN